MRSEAFTAARLGDPHRFDVDELADAIFRQLAAIARALDPPEGQARLRLHEAVHEHRARLDLGGHALGAGAIPSPHRGPEPVRRVVGEAHGIVLVLGAYHRRHRPERLLVEGGHALVHGGEQGGRIERPLAGRDLAPEQALGPALDRLLDLLVEGIPEIGAGLRTDLRLARQGIAHATALELAAESLDELVRERFDDDEALSRDAALAAIDQPRV